MKSFRALAIAWLCAAGSVAGCNVDTSRGSQDATEAGSCADVCGGQSEAGCWCDTECESWGDCCADKALVCDSCSDGDIVVTKGFEPSADDKECAVETQHCVTNDHSSCPQLSPRPPGWCSDGEVVPGAPTFITSSDGMECQMPSSHCVTNDSSACPQLSPRPPGWCSGGEVVKGDSHFIPSADGKECELPQVHCVTTDAGSCS
ncbi:MAG TPA: hypothetical protein VFB62_08835, partial [Polyangiaceae bacterium]|nr:hypothetical protein [Polyangiaceae bacterium]